MTDDPRDYNHGEILTFVMKDNEAENPERLTGLYVRTSQHYAGVRTVDDTYIDFENVRDVRRVPVIKNVPLFMVEVSQRIGELSSVGLGDEDRRVIGKALKEVIDGITPIPPEPPQWTVAKVTYHNPGASQSGWDYYVRELDLPDFENEHTWNPTTPRWMGPSECVSWAEMQKIGGVEIMPTPKREED